MEASPPPQDLGKLLFVELRLIFRSQRCQLLALSALFLFLPSAATVAFLVLISPLLYNILFTNLLNTTHLFDPNKHNIHYHYSPSWLFPALVACFLFNSASSSCAVGSIAYVIFHAKHQQVKVKLRASINALAASFFPLLATTLLLHAITLAITAVTFAAMLLVAMLLGFRNIDVYSINFLFYSFFPVAMTVISFAIYLQAGWSLAPVITAVEPSFWGLGSLRLSKSLMSGRNRRGVALSTTFIYSFIEPFLVLNTCFFSIVLITDNDEWKSLAVLVVVLILLNSSFVSMVRVNHVALKTLLYLHCIASTNGHDGIEDNVPAAKKYVSLADDDVKG